MLRLDKCLMSLLLAGGIAGCGHLEPLMTAPGWDVESVAAAPNPSDPMAAALRAGYLELARDEIGEYDWRDGARFLRKSKSATDGVLPEPETLAERNIRDEALRQPLALAETEMLALLGSEEAIARAPVELAEMQIDWECWAQEAEEGHQTDEITACRDAFDVSLATAQRAAQPPSVLVVVLPEEGGKIGGVLLQNDNGEEFLLDQPYAAASNLGRVQIAPADVREIFGSALNALPALPPPPPPPPPAPPPPTYIHVELPEPASLPVAEPEPAPQPQPEPEYIPVEIPEPAPVEIDLPEPPRSFVIYFGFGADTIDADGAQIVEQIADDILLRSEAKIGLIGHTDAVGNEAANLELSKRRALAVREAIEAKIGDQRELVFSTSFLGEAALAVATEGRERNNRRVDVTVE